MNLPDDYDPSQSYPLLVFLHGSAQTDEGLLDTARSDGRFIEIAPYGRDMYEAYSAPESQRDIVEAIEDAQLYFNIDPDRILIGGFSMGGYGALRTYAENPDLYAGVAVFAGHPNLANEWLGPGHPDYRQSQHYQDFINVPIFIYHGEADEALDVDQIRQFASGVFAAGGDVTTSYVPSRGHRYQDEATNALFHTWLEQFVEE